MVSNRWVGILLEKTVVEEDAATIIHGIDNAVVRARSFSDPSEYRFVVLVVSLSFQYIVDLKALFSIPPESPTSVQSDKVSRPVE
jgi:hypothetical protein